MSRLTRKTLIHAEIEDTYASNPLGWTGANAVLVANPKFRIVRDTVPRDLVRPFLGGSEHLVGSRVAEIGFDVEIAGSGTAGTAPAYGKLLRACGMAETVSAGSHVEYTPISDSFESIFLRYIVDGVKYAAKGCRGTVKFDLNAYKRPMMSFRFMGFDAWAATDDAVGSNYAAWKRPEVVTDANSADIRMGCTHAAGGGVVGGTALPSQGLEIDLGNKLSHIKMLNGEEIDISQRDMMGKMTVALSAADEVAWREAINLNTLTSLGFAHGSASGKKVVAFAPAVQRVDPQAVDYEGRHMMSTELRILPESGDDEFTFVVK